MKWTHFKLGLFAIAATGALVITALGLGVWARRTPTVEYHVWFDESVQGLDVGAPVDFRGVGIGEVARIDVASDGVHVDVALAITKRALDHVDLEQPALRAELSSQGFTGVKAIDIDLVDAAGLAGEPPIAPHPMMLQSRASFSKRLETQADRLARSLPAAVDDMRHAMRDVDSLVSDARADQLSGRLASLFSRTGVILDDFHALAPRVSAMISGVRHLSDDADAAVADVRHAVAGLGGADGLVASARRATDAAGDLGVKMASSPQDLERTLHDLAAAARAVRELVDELGRDPDMLVKGRAPSRRP